MVAKPYKLIFALLIASILIILALQAFWINNLYTQKREQLNQTIYSALEQVSTILRERENIHQIKQEITSTTHTIKINEERVNLGSSVLPSNYLEINGTKVSNVKGINLDSIKQFMDNMNTSTKNVTLFRPAIKGIYSINNDTKPTAQKSEKDKLMDKIIYEIKVMDAEETNGDSIANIIKRVFKNKGLFFSFEFALKKILKNKTEILTQSQAYKDSEESLVTDLSLGKIFNTHKFIYLQFPAQRNLVFSSMKNSLILSLLFSGIIISIFYYTSRLILQQKKLSEMKNDFMNNMTHELKTPIATISLATDAINNPLIKNDDEKFKDYTRILKEENQKLNSHVERVLQMAMLDKGQLQLNLKQVNVTKLIENTIHTFKLQIIEHKAIVNFSNSADTFVYGDEQHLQSVFNNLLDNALKYSKEDCRIDIRIERSSKEVVINFKDNGIGIAHEKQQKVFEKFYRAQGGNLHDVKGFGLGLSYINSIIQAHGGTLRLRSEHGQGSEFSIYLKADA
jgi:two-component system, OmpR family, phosphate regulon sensor histidine kinase PhoR